jgi:3',5'-cyclic AMP phosphodiesterase CpdA
MKKIFEALLKISPFSFLLIFSWISFGQFTFVHITDIHVADGLSAGEYDLDGTKFEQMLTTINNLVPKPAFVVAGGDISHAGNGSPSSMYEALTQHLYPAPLSYPMPGEYFIDSALTIPIYFTPGNHDYRTGNVPPLSDTALTYYSMFVSPDSDYAVSYSNAILLFVRSGYDDNRPIWEDTNPMNPEGSGFTSSQCSWLRNILQDNSAMKKIIVMHHPPVDAIGTNWDGTPFTGGVNDTADGSIKYNRTMFLDICDSNNVDIVLAGHEHQDVVANRAGSVISENYTGDGTRYVQTGTTLYGSYRVISVYSDSVNVSLPQLSIPTAVSGHNNEDLNPLIFYDYANNKLVVSFHDITYENRTEIKIYTITGQLFFAGNYHNEEDIIINTLNFPKGIFILKLNYNDNTEVKKIVIE